MVVAGLSNCGTVADGTSQAFLSLSLSGLSATDIGLLQGYVHLQTVDISHNQLTGTMNRCEAHIRWLLPPPHIPLPLLQLFRVWVGDSGQGCCFIPQCYLARDAILFVAGILTP